MHGYFIDLELGKLYSITIRLDNGYLFHSTGLKFIQVTPKGFNFLDIDKSKCVFERHFYRSIKKNKFYVSKRLKFIKENDKP